VAEGFREIELRKIHPNRLNPRLEINIERLNELADSIKEVGLLEPIIVRPKDDEFEVVVGERRYRAAQQAKLEKVPVIVRDLTDEQVVRLNLIENIQREDLSAIERGKVCKQLLERYPEEYPSQVVAAKKIGVSKDAVSLWLRSVEVVPSEAQKYVAASTISREVPQGKIDYMTAVKIGRSIKEPGKRVEVIRKLSQERLPVKDRNLVIEKVAQEPDKTVEKIIEEVAETPYGLPFRLTHMKPILEGKKIQTSRTGIPDPKVKVGAIIHASVWEPHFADLRITAIDRKRLKDFDESDAKREGGYALQQFRKAWKEIHGDWNEDQIVYVIHFERVK
jgi:ParB family chromosome partitioning protein